MLIGSVAENIVRQRTALFSSHPLFESSLGDETTKKGGQDLRRNGNWRLVRSPGRIHLGSKESHMKTMSVDRSRELDRRARPFDQPFDLIDVRTKKNTIRRASPVRVTIPLPRLRAPKVLRDRKLSATSPLYVICRSRVLAGLATRILRNRLRERRCRRRRDGGLAGQGLPVVREMVPKDAIDVDARYRPRFGLHLGSLFTKYSLSCS